jgi:hypothetical protein
LLKEDNWSQPLVAVKVPATALPVKSSDELPLIKSALNVAPPEGGRSTENTGDAKAWEAIPMASPVAINSGLNFAIFMTYSFLMS